MLMAITQPFQRHVFGEGSKSGTQTYLPDWLAQVSKAAQKM